MDNNFNELSDDQKEQSLYSGNYQQPVYNQKEQSLYSSDYQQPTENQVQQSTYTGGYKQSSVYQQPPSYQSADLEEPISMGHWFLCLLVCMIPCVNVIVMLVWAFSSSEKKSKSNFFKAALIWLAIQTLLSIVLSTLFIGAIASQIMAF